MALRALFRSITLPNFTAAGFRSGFISCTEECRIVVIFGDSGSTYLSTVCCEVQ